MSIEPGRNSLNLVICFVPDRVSQHGNTRGVRSFSGGGIGRRAALLMQFIGGSMPSPRAICARSSIGSERSASIRVVGGSIPSGRTSCPRRLMDRAPGSEPGICRFNSGRGLSWSHRLMAGHCSLTAGMWSSNLPGITNGSVVQWSGHRPFKPGT